MSHSHSHTTHSITIPSFTPYASNPLFAYTNEQPHLLLYGEPGVGKHRAVADYLREKYQPLAHYQHAVSWICCMNPDIQQDLSTYVKTIGYSVYRAWVHKNTTTNTTNTTNTTPKTNTTIVPHTHTKNKPPRIPKKTQKNTKNMTKTDIKDSTPNYRVIVLDGIEYIPYSTQATLRRCIEMFSEHTRFILIGHSYTSLMTPIQSRFILVRMDARCTTLSKDILKGFGKRPRGHKNTPVELTTYSRNMLQEYDWIRDEYTHLRNQLNWLSTWKKGIFAGSSDSTSHQFRECAKEWVSHGWSMLDLQNLLVYETSIWISNVDTNGVQKACQDVWTGIPMKDRYALWKLSDKLSQGQSYELFWVAWMLAELVLLWTCPESTLDTVSTVDTQDEKP